MLAYFLRRLALIVVPCSSASASWCSWHVGASWQHGERDPWNVRDPGKRQGGDRYPRTRPFATRAIPDLDRQSAAWRLGALLRSPPAGPRRDWRPPVSDPSSRWVRAGSLQCLRHSARRCCRYPPERVAGRTYYRHGAVGISTPPFWLGICSSSGSAFASRGCRLAAWSICSATAASSTSPVI